MKELNFRYTYCLLTNCRKKNLIKRLYESEKDARTTATDYEDGKSVELVSFTKVGWFKYLAIWKITGYLKEGE